VSIETPIWVGIDVGGTKIEAMAVGLSPNPMGSVLGSVRLPTPDSGPEDLIEAIEVAARRAAEASGRSVEEIRTVGIGMPGQIQDGVVRIAVNLNLHDYPLAEILEKRFGRPVRVENDVRTAALGAYHWIHSRQPIHRLVYLSIGTGVAAAMVLDGIPYTGADHLAGEIGHAVVDPEGPPCACGGRGCLEVWVSGPALVRQAQEELERGEPSRLARLQPLEAPAIYEAARQGDPVAHAILARSGRFLAMALQWLALTWDPELIVIGGGIAQEGEAFLNPVWEALEALRGTSRVGRELFQRERLLLVPKDVPVALWGAIRLAQAADPAAPDSL
jgi:glucokinase